MTVIALETKHWQVGTSLNELSGLAKKYKGLANFIKKDKDGIITDETELKQIKKIIFNEMTENVNKPLKLNDIWNQYKQEPNTHKAY